MTLGGPCFIRPSIRAEHLNSDAVIVTDRHRSKSGRLGSLPKDAALTPSGELDVGRRISPRAERCSRLRAELGQRMRQLASTH
jgi:hypothetical protein